MQMRSLSTRPKILTTSTSDSCIAWSVAPSYSSATFDSLQEKKLYNYWILHTRRIKKGSNQSQGSTGNQGTRRHRCSHGDLLKRLAAGSEKVGNGSPGSPLKASDLFQDWSNPTSDYTSDASLMFFQHWKTDRVQRVQPSLEPGHSLCHPPRRPSSVSLQ